MMPPLRGLRRAALVALVLIAVLTLLLTTAPNTGPRAPRRTENLVPFSQKMPTLRCLMEGGCRRMLFSPLVWIDWIGNVAVFVPLGLTSALAAWPNCLRPRAWWWGVLLLLGMGFSIGIELLQRSVPGRVTDVDDVILNSAGFLIGAVLAQLVVGVLAVSHRFATRHRGL